MMMNRSTETPELGKGVVVCKGRMGSRTWLRGLSSCVVFLRASAPLAEVIQEVWLVDTGSLGHLPDIHTAFCLHRQWTTGGCAGGGGESAGAKQPSC
jgi:hypothetical protein